MTLKHYEELKQDIARARISAANLQSLKVIDDVPEGSHLLVVLPDGTLRTLHPSVIRTLEKAVPDSFGTKPPTIQS
jgi:hypothetical protein